MNRIDRIEEGWLLHKRYKYNDQSFKKKLKYIERDLLTLVKIGFGKNEMMIVNIEKTLTAEIWIRSNE